MILLFFWRFTKYKIFPEDQYNSNLCKLKYKIRNITDSKWWFNKKLHILNRLNILKSKIKILKNITMES